MLFSKEFQHFLVILLLSVVLYTPFRSDAAVMSIDYGTEWIKVGLVKPGTPMDIVLGRDSKRKTQSSITIRDEERIYGSDSVSLATRFPRSTFFSLKRVLGRTFDDKHSQEYRAIYPNEMIPIQSRNTVAFRYDNETYFTVEELVAMQFGYAKEQAEATAQEPVKDVVITVPPFYTQFERQAILDAADLAGLKVLSLINDETAVAINYAINQLSTFTDEPQYHIFYDMGAGSTVASLISFNTQTVKDVGRYNKNIIHVEVKSVGYDRTLGGLEFDLKLQKHLANEFDRIYQDKLKTSVFTSERAMLKLLKEANRVKQILSANTETIASAENLHEEHDFRFTVTRTELENLSSDLLKRVSGPIETALKNSGLAKDDIKSLVLVGGGVRVPAIQAILTDIFGESKIAKSVNGDEAAALGAVFRGAGLSGKFKVKDIKIKDITLYPIEVGYESEQQEINGTPRSKVHQMHLFKFFSPIGSRKIMTFKHTSDFTFTLKYDENAETVGDDFGPTDIATAHVSGLSNAINSFKDASVESPKVKVTLELSDSGVVSVTDAVVTIATERTSLTDKVKSFFGVNKNNTEEPIKDAPIPEDMLSKNSASPTTSTTSSNEDTGNETESKSTKVETVTLNFNVQHRGIPPLDNNQKTFAFNRLRSMDRTDRERRAREEARNNLEAFVYRAQELLHDELIIQVSTSQERAHLSSQLSEISDWIYEGGERATTEKFIERLNYLGSLHDPIVFRRNERLGRPEAVSSLQSTINITREYVQRILNATSEERYHSDRELDKALNVCDSAEQWLTEKLEKQVKLPPHADPIFTTAEIGARGQEIYNHFLKLINKRPPKKKEASSQNGTINNASSSSTSISSGSTTGTSSKVTPTHEQPPEEIIFPNTESSPEAGIHEDL